MLLLSFVNKSNRRRFIFLALATLLPVPHAYAQSESKPETDLAPRRGFSLGGRAVYYRPKGADRGSLGEGLQARAQFTPRWAMEVSGDLRQNTFGATKVDVVPIQLSLMAYIMPPGYRLSPFVLGGGGWYYTHVGMPVDHSGFRFGPHLGAGLEFFISSAWSLDASYRYLWTEDIHSQDAAHPLGRNFSDQGFMLTGALNYRL